MDNEALEDFSSSALSSRPLRVEYETFQFRKLSPANPASMLVPSLPPPGASLPVSLPSIQAWDLCPFLLQSSSASLPYLFLNLIAYPLLLSKKFSQTNPIPAIEGHCTLIKE